MPNKEKNKRLIDTGEYRTKLEELALLQVKTLLERGKEGILEATELRLIWDMVKTHGIGMDSVDELVQNAQREAHAKVESMEIDEDWGYDNG